MTGRPDDAIVAPRRGARDPHLAPTALMVSSQADLELLVGCLPAGAAPGRRLFTSRLLEVGGPVGRWSLAGPMIGAPYAVMLLETLLAWGAQQVVYLGWCGSIAHGLEPGAVIVPTAACIDEGTSRHYGADLDGLTEPSATLTDRLARALEAGGLDFQRGKIWTTDALFRETRSRVQDYQAQGCLAVEMEVSALCAVARHRNAHMAAVLVVSDVLATLRWQPGFKDPRFAAARRQVGALLVETMGRLTVASRDTDHA